MMQNLVMAGRLGGDRHRPGDRNRPDQGGMRQAPSYPWHRRRGGGANHATCSICHSAWMALRPSYSQLMPYRGRLTRCRVALDTQAGEPGTEEKMESRRVVTRP